MSGIAGIVLLDGTCADASQIRALTAGLQRRGPDGTHVLVQGKVALGHTLLATTPESLIEVLPLTDEATGCVITADARLDNRDELMTALGLAQETRTIGDGELILQAFLKWGEHCPTRLLGDFAFAIWDPRSASLMCVRDQIGMRQLTYHFDAQKNFVFATEPAAILVLSQIDPALNHDRIVDYLGNMEGADLTSTFFQNVYRLPPAHSLKVDCNGVRIWRYWDMTPEPTLELPSDEAYADAFLERFTEAVRCRLRSAGTIGAMVSGGIDSNAVAAVAANLLANESRGLLPSFSAIGPNPSDCVETRAINTALQSAKFAPTTVCHAALGELRADLERETAKSAEPFDANMTLIRAVYLAARRAGINTVLDGGSSDVLLSSKFHLAYLFRKGKFRQLMREAKGERRFWGPHFPAWHTLLVAAWQAYAPAPMRAIRFGTGRRKANKHFLAWAGAVVPFLDLTHALARRQHVKRRDFDHDRLDALSRMRMLTHPRVATSRERYDRVAGAIGIEPRDPFLDLRLIRFCLSLPREQLQRDGWPKWILRKAISRHVPPEIVWRRGKEHLGAEFTRALIEGSESSEQHQSDAANAIKRYELKKTLYLSNWFAYIEKRHGIRVPKKGEKAMEKHQVLEPKLPYSSPKLVAYGDMAKLTMGGSGSIDEATSGDFTPGNNFEL